MVCKQRLILIVVMAAMSVKTGFAEDYQQRLERIEREHQQWNSFMAPMNGGNSSASSVYYGAIAYSPSTSPRDTVTQHQLSSIVKPTISPPFPLKRPTSSHTNASMLCGRTGVLSDGCVILASFFGR